MQFVFSRTSPLLTASVVYAALFCLIAIVALIGFILLRRSYRARYFMRRDARVLFFRSRWDEVVSGAIPARRWRSNPLDQEIVETLLLDSIDVAADEQLPGLLACLHASGLLDQHISQARVAKGWKRQAALVKLGRTRALEAIPALVEGLDGPSVEIRTAALRGLGGTALPEAAIPILERFTAGRLAVPIAPLKNALLSCCRKRPAVLITYLHHSQEQTRELLARVLSEVCTAGMDDELALLCGDPSPEVRASAARALARTGAPFALPQLSHLAADETWFVRLRAVVALSAFPDIGAIEPLIRGLCDLHRLVRQQSAAALVMPGRPLGRILKQTVATQDVYALQAFVSALERTGQYGRLFRSLKRQPNSYDLLQVLREARQQLSNSRARSRQNPRPKPPAAAPATRIQRLTSVVHQ